MISLYRNDVVIERKTFIILDIQYSEEYVSIYVVVFSGRFYKSYEIHSSQRYINVFRIFRFDIVF